MRLKQYKGLILVFLCLSLISCSLTKPVQVVTKQDYVIDYLPQSPRATNQRGGVLLIARPKAAAGFRDQTMRYEAAPYQLAKFTKNQWVTSPAEMLGPLMLQTLREANSFDAVVFAPFSGDTDYRLETELVTLKQNFLTHPSQIELVIDAQLVNSNSQDVIGTHRFSYHQKTSQDTPYGGVVATNQAVGYFLTDLAKFVSIQ